MAECDYCGERFDDEEALLEHMGDEHEGELGRIDQRRVAEVDGGDGEIPTGPIALGLIIFVSAAVVAFVVFGGGGGNGGESLGELPDRGSEELLTDVEQFPSEGTQHVDAGTDINYTREPPLSGTHYGGQTVSAGFYEEPQAYGALVHSLEHGAVVIYYDPAGLTPEAEQNLKSYANTYTGSFSSVVVVPNPREEPRGTYVLTAWRHRLVVDDYDENVTRAFVAEYLGRGPENPVR